MKIGFIGLGAMGTVMVTALLEAGHDLYVYNRTPQKAASLCEKGAHITSSPAECAAQGNIVFSMTYDDAALKHIVEGPHGLISGLKPNGLHIACSTLSLDMANFLAEQHAACEQLYLSAPVLGRPSAVKDKKLYAMMAGLQKAKEIAKPVLQTFCQTVFDVGETPAQANLIKLSFNFLILTTIEQMGEIFALNEKLGINPQLVLKIMLESFFSGPVYKNYGPLITAPPKPEGKVEASIQIGAKDTALLLRAAEHLQTPLPLASLIRDRLIATQAKGQGEEDFASLAQRAREDANLV